MASLIQWLAYAGAHKTDGSAVASGRAYFYQPGTTNTQVTVYSDQDGLAALSQPVSLDAGGRAVVYAKAALRVEVQDSTGATVRLSDRANTLNAAQVEIEQTGYTGTSLTTGSQVSGGRTDLSTVLGSAYTSLGPNFQYSESATATARAYSSAVGLWVTPQDFGAVGNDVADDTTAFQAAITRAISAQKGLFIPPGTYRLSSGLTITGASAAGLRIEGASRANCIIKQYSTTATTLTINLSSAIESHIVLSNFQISANTTSSGTAITVTNGDGVRFEHVTVGKHREGFNCTAVSYTYLNDCVVASCDSDGSGSKGFRLGAHATALHCRAINNTMIWGFSLEGASANLAFCKSLAASVKGFDITAATCTLTDCHAASATTGYVVTSVGSITLVGNTASSCTTGFSLSGVTSGSFVANNATGCTTDLTTNATSTGFHEVGNIFTTRTLSEANGATWMGARGRVLTRNRTANSSAPPQTFTPDPKLGELQVFVNTSTTAGTFTIAATATTGLVDGQKMWIAIENQQDTNNHTLSWNSQYVSNNVLQTTLSRPSVGSNQLVYQFIWRASSAKWIMVSISFIQTTSGVYAW